ncbi:MAG: sigma-70 family RNA polymerase sigma factor, partial [Planctomycetota bacterium]
MARDTANPDFEALVRDHHGDVWLAARRVLRSDDQGLDAVQEVFLRLLDGRLVVERSADAKSVLCWWSIRIALDMQRRDRRRREREDEHAMARRDETTGVLGAETDDARLWREVESLPDELRVPLVLRFAHGLGYARIGEAVGVAESTAHERVRRGLARLRELVVRAGLAGVALELETRIARSAPSSAPAGLEHTLLGLGDRATATAVGSSSFVGALVALVVVACGGLWYGLRDRGDVVRGGGTELALEDPPATHEFDGSDSMPLILDEGVGRVALDAAPDDGGAENGSAGVAASDDDGSAAEFVATVVGRIVDPLGGPVSDARVAVLSVERDGKFPTYSAEGVTDSEGLFEVRVEVADETGSMVRVQAVRDGYSIGATEPTRVLPDRTTALGAIEFRRGEGLLDGPFSLDVAVVDTLGRPVPGARLELASTVPLPVPEGSSWPQWLNQGDRLEKADGVTNTDPGGRARFEGERVGGKRLRVRPPTSALAPALVRFDVAIGEAAELTVVLEPSRTIEGRFTFDGVASSPALVGSLRAWTIEPASGVWLFPDVDDDGRFRFAGLASGEYRIRAEGGLGTD